MTDVFNIPKAGEEICDFCSSPEIKWRYPTKSFEYPSGPGFEKTGSHGDWAACDICHDFIESGDWDGLADWSLQTMLGRKALGFAALTKDEIQLIRGMLVELHKRFREHRMGDALRAYYGRA